MHQDPGERSSDLTRDWPRLACACPGVSSIGVGWWWPASGLGALSGAVHAWDLLKEVTIIFITSTIVRPQVNNREGTQIHPSTKTWIKDFLSIAPLIRTRARSPSVSLSYQEASISLLSFSIRGQTDWKPKSQKTKQYNHMDHEWVSELVNEVTQSCPNLFDPMNRSMPGLPAHQNKFPTEFPTQSVSPTRKLT